VHRRGRGLAGSADLRLHGRPFVRSGRAWTSHSGAEPSIRSKGRTGRWKDNRFHLDIKTGSKQINAPSESILDKPSFRKTAVKGRELVPAEGYYEWQTTEDG
jgi:putative SOS response-associated peptidase YedK